MSPQDFVEANSLSGLNQLAGCPPKYPRNPTEQKRANLVLYIARVPGSNDIILTTLKPQLKNVTSEDIASSLYYLHLNSDEDVHLLSEEQSIPARALSKKTLPRKPLPAGSRAQSLDIDRQSILNSKRQAPALDIQQDDTWRLFDFVTPRDSLANTPTVAEAAKAFSITIIRRDPTSGGQWNVGTVEGKSNPPTVGMAATKKPYYDISVHITTPGYNYFRHHTHPTTNIKLGGTTPSRGAQGATSQPPGNEGPTSMTQKGGVPGSGFHRQVSMEWASSWNKTFRQHKKAMSDFSGNHSRNNSGSSEGPHESDLESRSMEGSENSRAKGYTFLSPWEGTCTFSTGGAGRSLRCRHKLPAPVSADSLASSSTSVTVSELRFNLPSSDLFDREKMDLAAAQVKSGSSKLTRKLGSFRKRLSKPNPQRPSETQPHQTSHTTPYASNGEEVFSLPPRPSSISSSYEEDSPPLPQRLHNFLDELTISNDNDDRLDLSIGQEKAGGGNRGKRAKLGKLIIHDEGLKMLDLVVAANIGVWWTVWNPN
ncbi:hypothetical protein SS1G_11896 [Sclerotinia sclerotiorum 1980 UF-70]|uniref:Oxidoreductase-like protein n=1 Tax=Sclerotinia sclerotiorum (strain ATCC 18683 / 1980 / Ss-1) TaxID=665079 RepID=A7F3Q0_SCLS1|nr:hypothetical protein SS1G_11896 [Sclerotinia sclerotiorum 1980 UF-70]EDN97371.1 hypothetical protein SS1G_11896 [Sclerotinia sclerotiorum 1980 UF-70]